MGGGVCLSELTKRLQSASRGYQVALQILRIPFDSNKEPAEAHHIDASLDAGSLRDFSKSLNLLPDECCRWLPTRQGQVYD
jgi:hypothetical protein